MAIIVSSGVTDIISSGQTETGTTIFGKQQVLSGGTAISASVLSNGSQTILGGIASDTAVAGSSSQIVSGGTAIGTTLMGMGTQSVYSGGTTTGTVVDTVPGLGYLGTPLYLGQTVYSGATAIGTVVEAGAITVSGGVISGTTVTGSDYGFVNIDAGGIGSGTILSGLATEQVNVSGLAVGTVVESSATQFLSGGTGSSTVVNAGGMLELTGHASAIGATINSGGILLESESIGKIDKVNNLTVQGGAFIEVENSAGINSAAIVSGQLQFNSGGTVVTAFGLAGDSTDLVVQQVIVGAYDVHIPSFDLLVGSRGAPFIIPTSVTELVYSGPAAGPAVITGGGQVVASGGIDSGSIIQSGATATISAGGVSDAATIMNSGEVTVGGVVVSGVESGGGVTSGTLISSGGVEFVRSGLAMGSIIRTGGSQSVFAFGIGSGTIISSGGREYLSSGAIGNSEQVLSGGVEYVSSGATATNTHVLSGGIEQVMLGGVINGMTLDSGGTLVAAGTVGDLNPLVGAIIDVGVIADGASVNSSGQLVVTSSGTTVYTLGLDSGTGGLAFATAANGSGGTQITVTSANPDTNTTSGTVTTVISST